MANLVICADGTWNKPEEDLAVDHPTTVLKLARAVAPSVKTLKQHVFYDRGLGSYHDSVSAGVAGHASLSTVPRYCGGPGWSVQVSCSDIHRSTSPCWISPTTRPPSTTGSASSPACISRRRASRAGMCGARSPSGSSGRITCSSVFPRRSAARMGATVPWDTIPRVLWASTTGQTRWALLSR